MKYFIFIILLMCSYACMKPSLESIQRKYIYETNEEENHHNIRIYAKKTQEYNTYLEKEIDMIWQDIGNKLCQTGFTGDYKINMALRSWDGVTSQGKRTGSASMELEMVEGKITCNRK